MQFSLKILLLSLVLCGLRRHAPHNVYPCEGDDNWIAIDIGTDAEFEALCRVLNLALASDRRFATPGDRLVNLAALDAEIGAATRTRDKEELFHALQRARVCAAPTHDALEALADAQLNERGFFEKLPCGDDAAEHRYPGLMFRMQRTPNRLRSGPVRLGADSREIYCGLLGYSKEEYAALESRGLVGTGFPASIWSPPGD